MAVVGDVLQKFGLQAKDFAITRIGSGHIHETYRLSGSTDYVLQRVNNKVFKQPEMIASNLRIAAAFLKKNFPAYPFLSARPASDGADLIYDSDGSPWRLFPFIANTFTIDRVENADQARSAASEFARLTANLNRIDVTQFKETIPRFHDLHLRFEQFETALAGAQPQRRQQAAHVIAGCLRFRHLLERYDDLLKSKGLRLRITHNDTKINNILFDATTGKASCVIDLDTLMPGYFIYDLGDMVRTFVSPVDEEEKDLSKIIFRKDIYDALTEGYLSHMGPVMSPDEYAAIPFAGKMMTYIMLLRFTADFMNGDVYYHTTYPGQNLVRAENQLCFLEKVEAALPT
ncbi:MAG TPA: aminoglycoside phosphotransferase family protein [Cyclobacteriaceae bacterium]|nr:aminoglycoside phosphotransferase family protein [Cyclobacteriaceae bacterium]